MKAQFHERVVSETLTEYISYSNDSTEYILVLFVGLVLFIFSVLVYLNAISTTLTTFSLVLLIAIILIYQSNYVVEESILIIQDFGIQLRQKCSNSSEVTKVYFNYI
jgi:hypothetical protein